MQWKVDLTIGLSLILILTQKSLATLHVEQLPSICVLDLLSNCGAMSNRSRMERGTNFGGTSLKKRENFEQFSKVE